MPSNPRRRATRRRLPPRPTFQGAAPPAASPEGVAGARPSQRSQQAMHRIERDTPYLEGELWRVAGVTGACLGLLAVLVVIDRLQ